MKLIDLLVQELPKLGGWPEGAVECERYLHEGNIDFYDADGNWPEDCGEKYGYQFAESLVKERVLGQVAETEVVTKDEYESALAASKHVEWDGKEPVGCDCEYMTATSAQWKGCKIVAIGKEHLIAEVDETEMVFHIPQFRFRKKASEAERKREDTKNAIAELCRASASNGHSADLIYDAIAAGKIPGIKLSD